MNMSWFRCLIDRLHQGRCELNDISGSVIFLNPFSYLLLRGRLDIFSGVSKIFCDGILLVFIFRIFGLKISRYSFDQTSLAPVVFGQISDSKKTVFLLGSHENAIFSARKIIEVAYPELKISGCRNGFFANQNEMKDFASYLACCDDSPDFVIVGMGTPLQEEFSAFLLNSGFKGVIYTCGGFFHQISGNGFVYYPKIFDRLNLRWIYRMYDEPKLIRRYFLNYPVAVFFIVLDLLAWKLRLIR